MSGEKVTRKWPGHLFEVSWEVCNRVGGINTVLKSKAALMRQRFPQYALIGPYVERNATIEFEEREAPPEFKEVFTVLANQGVKCHYGTWQVKGEPTVILVDYQRLVPGKNELKRLLWEWYGIDSLTAGWDFEEPIIFSAAAAKLLRELEERLPGGVVAHCHEWLAGSTLLHLKRGGSKIRTVFTTHATMLGRAIAGSGGDLYDLLDTINPIEEAYRHNVQAKHLVEVACARHADVFTTVSEITSLEAERLLGRKPDALLLNGLDLSLFPTLEETSIKHITCREKLRAFLAYHFFPHYIFPLEHNITFFMTGRSEFKNKGIDLTISALGLLNDRMKKERSQRTVTVFFWIPHQNNGLKVELIENKNYYYHILNYLQYNSEKIIKKVLYDFLAQRHVTNETFFTKEFLKGMKRDILQFKRQGNPPISTHRLPDEQNNEIIRALRAAGLDNKEDDKVKVVLMPCYLDGNDGLFNLQYYDAIAGCHLGLFPSYYEPWGYTPLETAAMGVPAVTSDLSGFGRFIKPHLPRKNPGVWIVKRHYTPYEESAEELASLLHDFARLNRTGRVQNKIAAKRLAELCDWERFIGRYEQAYELALR